MSKRLLPLLVLAILFALPLPRAVLGAGYSEYIPSWEIGDTWDVASHPLAASAPMGGREALPKLHPIEATVRVHFTVAKIKEVDGNLCYELRAVCPDLPETAHVLLIRKRDFTVKEFHELQRAHGDRHPVRIKTHNGEKPFVRATVGSLCPFDLPLFPDDPTPRKQKRVFTYGRGGHKVTQTTTFGKDSHGEWVRFEMRSTLNGRELVSTQMWRRGEPWWREAERTIGGEKRENGQLVLEKKKK